MPDERRTACIAQQIAQGTVNILRREGNKRDGGLATATSRQRGRKHARRLRAGHAAWVLPTSLIPPAATGQPDQDGHANASVAVV